MFGASLPSRKTIMPRLPLNLHVVTTGRSPDNAIRKKHATRHVWSAAPATQNDHGALQSACACHKKCNTFFLKTIQKYCPSHTTRFSTLMKHVGMSRSATPAMRNEATRHLKPTRVTNFAELARGTAMLPSWRSLAKSCSGTPRQRRANTSQPLDPQSKTRNLRYAFGDKNQSSNPPVYYTFCFTRFITNFRSIGHMFCSWWYLKKMNSITCGRRIPHIFSDSFLFSIFHSYLWQSNTMIFPASIKLHEMFGDLPASHSVCPMKSPSDFFQKWWWNPKLGGYPSHHPFLCGMFPWNKPSSYWDTPMVKETFIHSSIIHLCKSHKSI